MSDSVIGSTKKKGIVISGEVNNHSGYGVVYKDRYTGFHLMGFAEDTVMDYPKNIFFDCMTADLAIQFRISTDTPTGELPAMLDDYMDTLKRGMSRDSYMQARISNVYAQGLL
jgi:hypothetical protein